MLGRRSLLAHNGRSVVVDGDCKWDTQQAVHHIEENDRSGIGYDYFKSILITQSERVR